MPLLVLVLATLPATQQAGEVRASAVHELQPLPAGLLWPDLPPKPFDLPTPEEEALAEVKRLARLTIVDGALIIVSNALDIYSTAIAVERRVNGQPVAAEANVFGQTVERRAALKAAAVAVELGGCAWLRLDGHHRAATVVRWLVVVINLGLMTNNLWRGAR